MKKQFFLFLWLIFMTMTVHSQNSLSIPTVRAGVEREATIEIHLDNTQPVAAFEFVLEVPADLTVVSKGATLTDRSNDHVLSQGNRIGNKIKFIAFTMNGGGFSGSDGAIVKIPVKTSSKYKEGESYPLKLSDVILSSIDAKDIGSDHKNGELKIVGVDSPDLTVTGIISTEKTITPKGTFSLSWEVKNIGTAIAVGGWKEVITLISSKTNYRKVLITSNAYKEDLDFNQSVSRSVAITLPSILGLDGDVKVEVKLVPESTVAELPSQLENNTVVANETLLLEKVLYFTLSKNSIKENESSDLVLATLTQSGDITQDYSYTITTNLKDQLVIPSEVTISKNASSTTFYISPIDNDVMDGDRVVTISVEGNGYDKVSTDLTIIDDDIPALKVTSSKMEVTDDDEFVVTVESQIVYDADVILNISADQSNRWTVPTQVTLPRGQKTVSFPVKVKNNRKPESTATGSITVRGESMIGDKVTIELTSSNVPQFKLEIYPTTISEGDGIYAATATITRLDKFDVSATLKISADVADALILPETISFPTGIKSKKFNIGVIDNDIVEPTREVKVKAVVYIADCSCEAEIKESEQIKSIFILDNDGPALKVVAEPTTVKAGVEKATKITVSRNVTDLSEALVVNLKSDVTSVVDMPQQVTIPAGQNSVSFDINTKIDKSLVGDQTVRIEASANNYADGFSWILVSDQNIPDAMISELKIETDFKGGGIAKVSTIIKNQGFATLSKGLKVDYYLSQNESTSGATLIANKYTTETIDANASITFDAEMTLPESAGDYYLIVVLNAEMTIKELDYKNNQKALKLELKPTYAAEISIDKNIYKQGESILMKGKAIGITRNATLAQREVEISIVSNNFARKEKVTTDADGNFAYTFVPVINENGHYTVGAGYPGKSETVQAQFDLLGLDWLDKVDYLKWEVVENEAQTKSFKVKNNTFQTLSDIRLSIPDEYKIVLESDPISLASGAEGVLTYRIIAKSTSSEQAYKTIPFSIVSAQGTLRSMQALFYSSSQLAKLITSPASINTTMIKGQSRYYEFDLINRSSIEAKNVKINLPSSIGWMKLSSPKEFASIAANDTVKVILLLKPTDKEQLNVPLSGTIGASVENGQGVDIPFRIETVSTETGKLSIDAIDEYTFNTASAPHVSGAKVVVRHPYSGKVMAEGVTNSDGIFETGDLAAGFYAVTVSATKHDIYQNNIEVDPGRTKTVKAFMPYQAVSIDWDVRPTEVDDEYQIDIVVDFETNVPKPVVVMSLTEQVPALNPGECFMTNVLLVNHGLIQAENIQINTPSRTGYTFELMTNLIEKLPAKASMYVPMKVCRKSNSTGGGTGGGTGGEDPSNPGGEDPSNPGGEDPSNPGGGGGNDCIVTVVTGSYMYYCDKNTGQWIVIQTGSVFIRTYPCPPSVPGGGSGPWGGGPWGGGFGGGGSGSWSGNGISTNIDCTKKKDPENPEDPEDPFHDCMTKVVKTGLGCITAFVEVKDWVNVAVNCGSLFFGNNSWSDYLGCGLAGITAIWKTIPIIKLIERTLCAYNVYDTWKTCSQTRGMKESEVELFVKDYEYYLMGLQYTKEIYTLLYDESFYEETNLAEFEQICLKYRGADNKYSTENITKIATEFKGSSVTEAQVISYLEKWNKSVDAASNNTSTEGLIDFKQLPVLYDKLVEVDKYAKGRGFEAKDGKSSYYYLAQYVEEKFKSLGEENEEDPSKNSVCATVTVKFSQKMTMTREAFEGTLTVNNGNTNLVLSDIILDLEVTDEDGNDANHLFQINKDNFLLGGGSVAGNESKTGTVIFIPTKEAAPTVPKSYSFGGVFSYYDEAVGERVTVTLHPVTLDVNPSPDLVLHYFMQRDILGDDPLTEDVVEPSIPAELALLIDNQGYGAAKNVKVASMQPEIIDNKLGLLIDFELIGSNFNNEPKQLGLNNINFGNIEPMSTALGQWWFTSTLLGHFVKYDIEVTHLSSYGNKNLSLIKDAFVHELIHSVKAYGTEHDDMNDFLVNDIPDLFDTPDAVYYSNGGKDDVYGSKGTVSNAISSANLKTTLTVTPDKNGWVYGKLGDPGKSLYTLQRVVRVSDSKELPLANFWQTHVTLLDGKDPVYENNLHFFDKVTESTEYTLHYAPTSDVTPEVLEFKNVTDKEVYTEPIERIEVVFNTEIDFSTFSTESITLMHQGNKLSSDEILIGRVDATTYMITFDKLTKPSGYYSLTVDCSNIKDLLGNTGKVGKNVSWTQVISELGIISFNANQEKAEPIETLEIVFNKDINPTNVTNSLFKLNEQPVENIIITPKENSKSVYILTGLKAYNEADNNYVLSVDLPQLEAIDGTKGLVEQLFEWTVDTKKPAVLSMTREYQGATHGQNVTDISIVLNREVVDFNLNMIKLLYKGIVVSTTELTLSKVDGFIYTLSGLRGYTEAEGSYSVIVDQSSLVDLIGNAGTGVAEESWNVSFGKPDPVQKMKITPDRGESDNDNHTSGDDLQISLDVTQDNRTLVVSVITPSGKVQLAEQKVATAQNVLIPIGSAYNGDLQFEAYVYDESGANSDVVTINAYIDVVEFDYTLKVKQTTCDEITSVTIEFSVPVDAKDLQNATILRVGSSDIPMSNMNITKLSPTTYILEDMAHMLSGGTVSLGIDMSKIYKSISGLKGKGLRFDVLGYSSISDLYINGDKEVERGTITTYSTNADMSGYDWHISGGEIITQRNEEIEVLWTTEGEQAVLLESRSGSKCVRSISYPVDISGDAMGEGQSLLITPNPNNGIFDVVYKKQGDSNVTLLIYNMSGVVVYRKANIAMNDILSEKVDIRSSKQGVYFVTIDNKGKKTVVKMIKK